MSKQGLENRVGGLHRIDPQETSLRGFDSACMHGDRGHTGLWGWDLASIARAIGAEGRGPGHPQDHHGVRGSLINSHIGPPNWILQEEKVVNHRHWEPRCPPDADVGSAPDRGMQRDQRDVESKSHRGEEAL